MGDPMRVVIVDDEPLAVERLRLLCSAIPEVDVIADCEDGLSLLALLAVAQPDLVLLDIAMPGMSGIEIARRLEADNVLVVFITALDGYALEAFDLSAVDYLLKPALADRLERALGRARAHLTRPLNPLVAKERDLWVRSRGQMIRLAIEAIEVIEADRDYVRLHTGKESYLLHHTITRLEAKLDSSQFLRIHRSTIVRQNQIVRLKVRGAGQWSVDLANGRTFAIGASYLTVVKNAVRRDE